MIKLEINHERIVTALHGEAKQYDCTPQQLAMTLLEKCLYPSLVDAVLDGADPRLTYNPKGARKTYARGLTDNQHAVLGEIAQSDVIGGKLFVSQQSIAGALRMDPHTVQASLDGLLRKGILRQVGKAEHSSQRPSFVLTEMGKAQING